MIAVHDELARAVVLAAAGQHAATVRVSVEQLAERWTSAAVVVMDGATAAELRELRDVTRLRRQARTQDEAGDDLGSRAGRPTVLLYEGRLVDMTPAAATALWRDANALEVTHVLPHEDWSDSAVTQGWSQLIGALLALGSTPLGPDEYDLGVGR